VAGRREGRNPNGFQNWRPRPAADRHRRRRRRCRGGRHWRSARVHRRLRDDGNDLERRDDVVVIIAQRILVTVVVGVDGD
jgi:hypothetical protein